MTAVFKIFLEALRELTDTGDVYCSVGPQCHIFVQPSRLKITLNDKTTSGLLHNDGALKRLRQNVPLDNHDLVRLVTVKDGDVTALRFFNAAVGGLSFLVPEHALVPRPVLDLIRANDAGHRAVSIWVHHSKFAMSPVIVSDMFTIWLRDGATLADVVPALEEQRVMDVYIRPIVPDPVMHVGTDVDFDGTLYLFPDLSRNVFNVAYNSATSRFQLAIMIEE